MKKYLCALFTCLMLLPAVSVFAEPEADFSEAIFDDESSASSSKKSSASQSKDSTKYQNAITFSLGGWPSTEWLIGTCATKWGSASDKSDFKLDNSFAMSLQYLYTTDDRKWTFGPAFTFSHYAAKAKKADVDDYIVNSFSLMIKVRKDYFADNFVRLFADYGAGVEMLTVNGSSYPMLAWAAYPLGFSAGIKNFIVEFAFGFGNQGSLATFSAGYRF